MAVDLNSQDGRNGHTRNVAPAYKSMFAKRLRWIHDNRPGLENLNKLSVMVVAVTGGSRSTIGNGLRTADREGREPAFDQETLVAIAAVAQVSLSWLMLGGDLKPEGPGVSDIPPKPAEPLENVKKRMSPKDRVKVLQAEIVRLQNELAAAKQPQK